MSKSLGNLLCVFKCSDIGNKIRLTLIKRSENKNTTKIIKNSIYIQQNMTNTNVIRYIKFIKSIDIPSRILCKNVIIDAYKAIKNTPTIEDHLKSDLRFLLECKGVSFVY